jgi:hypothetical protein
MAKTAPARPYIMAREGESDIGDVPQGGSGGFASGAYQETQRPLDALLHHLIQETVPILAAFPGA